MNFSIRKDCGGEIVFLSIVFLLLIEKAIAVEIGAIRCTGKRNQRKRKKKDGEKTIKEAWW